MGFLNDEQIEIACPNCGFKIKKTLGWFKQYGHLCPGCSATLKTDQTRRDLEKIECGLSELFRKIDKLGR